MAQAKVENPASASEQTPLLQEEQGQQGQYPEPETAAEPDAGQGEQDLEESERAAKHWTRWAWRGFWTVAAIFILAVFIKGWVDAGDVDVCSSTLPPWKVKLSAAR